MNPMLKILQDNPLLLLFLVAAIGYPLGQIRIFGTSLGVAAVLFVGLAFGSLSPDLKLPEIVYMLGLGLFIYSIGLSSGPTFLVSLRRQGLRYNIMVLGIIAVSAAMAAGAGRLLQLPATLTAGMFAGSMTSTPALAGALETIKHSFPATALERLLADPVIGYSLTYPMGVIGTVVALNLSQRLWRIDFADEAKELRALGAHIEPLRNCTIRVDRSEVCCARTLEELRLEQQWDVVFGRIKRGGHSLLAAPDEKLEVGDLVTVVGAADEIAQAASYLGTESEEEIDLDRSEFDFRRIFLSNPQVAGRRLKELDLRKRFGAVITRVRRGDDDFIPDDDLVLELGDRVRVLTHTDNMKAVTRYFGDSYRAVSEVDVLSFSLGLALGLLLGIVSIPLPGGISFKFGFAGGPLIVALILGAVGRTGSMVWSLPYSANMTLRQVGMVLFLAGIGTRAGYSFLSTFSEGGGLAIFAAGVTLTCTASLLALWIGYRLLMIPMTILSGIIAGMQTQTAVLGYALDQTRNDLPNIGFASVYPVATISKIIVVQVLLAVLS